jgi:rhodanese-related sulfurtransferase
MPTTPPAPALESAAAALAAVQAGTGVIVDVREPDEWAEGVAQPAELLPLTDLRGARDQWGPFLAHHRDKRLFLYCRSGNRSGMAAALLAAEGFDTANIGAFSGWVASGLAVRHLDLGTRPIA